MSDALTPHLRESLTNEFAEDWQRQRRTAADIIQRLQTQEGVILADQVGMGKTFVALAVATSYILAKRNRRQVIVMVPGRVGEKWVREWEKFSNTLLDDTTPPLRCVPQAIRSGEDLLKALDDPPRRRSHILIVTHGAMTTNLKDSFIQLSLLYYATRRRTGAAEIRQRIARWSTGSSGLIRDSRLTPERVKALLNTPPEHWREAWAQLTEADGQIDDLGDEPVPASLCDVSEHLDLEELWGVIQTLPARRSPNLKARLNAARRTLNTATQSVWKEVLVSAWLHLPLLIFDEAHALKNDETRISRLFTPLPDQPQDGALQGIFDRMLFLTATPFELGHNELVNILSRLGAIRSMRPASDEPLHERLEHLKQALHHAQATALEMDQTWSLLSPDDISSFDTWTPNGGPPSATSPQARSAWRAAQQAVTARKEMYAALHPWIIRHGRPARRSYHQGTGVLPGHPASKAGLEIPNDAALPFLLSARAQAVAESQRDATRPLFAYGIASSYETFLRLDDGQDPLDTDDEDRSDEGEHIQSLPTSSEVDWYRNEIRSILNDKGLRSRHPKVTATSERALQLWLSGEKCLIFCWYIRSTEALHSTISDSLDMKIRELASAALGVEDSLVDGLLERVSDRLLSTRTGNHRLIKNHLVTALTNAAEEQLRESPQDSEAKSIDLEKLTNDLADVAIRNLRTPAFLVRYTNLTPALDAHILMEGIKGNNPAGIDLLERWRQFVKRLVKATEGERNDIIDALLGESVDNDAGAKRRGSSLSSVRRAYGRTRREDRERLITIFNTPFAPDILVASSVMGEGIDLHHECRHVIHHDLAWNPSRLEQRTGRLDRIGALAERLNADIEIYEPYLAGTHDEKMFRVVKDRAGWFDIVMGRSVSNDEQQTDAEESRLPLHPRISEALAMDLRSPQ